jgi:hypothetical protein
MNNKEMTREELKRKMNVWRNTRVKMFTEVYFRRIAQYVFENFDCDEADEADELTREFLYRFEPTIKKNLDKALDKFLGVD